MMDLKNMPDGLSANYLDRMNKGVLLMTSANGQVPA